MEQHDLWNEAEADTDTDTDTDMEDSEEEESDTNSSIRTDYHDTPASSRRGCH